MAMTTPLPQGLIRVVSATTTEAPTGLADIIYERKQVLHKFWQKHATLSRATRDATDIRCKQLFWRIWGHPHLSTSLNDLKLMELWTQCQQRFDLTPFDLTITYQPDIADHESISAEEAPMSARRLSKTSQASRDSNSMSPSPVVPSEENQQELLSNRKTSSRKGSKAGVSTRPDTRPTLPRTNSTLESSRKRLPATANTTRGKARPSMSRKRSSQAGQPSEPSRPRRSIMKSPRTSSDDVATADSRRDRTTTSLTQMISSPSVEAELPHRKISAFELPSTSSWQSVESHDHDRPGTIGPIGAEASSSLVIDRNFRERFLETQNVLRSSTNFADVNRTMKKTGSVVRFADEVDVPEAFRKLKLLDQEKDNPIPQLDGIAGRAASAGQGDALELSLSSQVNACRPGRLMRHDSGGSVAAVSDNSGDDAEEGETGMVLPRIQSSLSLGIATLKRSQSTGENRGCDSDSFPITSPQIEEHQEALISGRATKQKTKEEQQLLAMGHKDGVTKAGGVHLPKELTVQGPRPAIAKIEDLEAPTF